MERTRVIYDASELKKCLCSPNVPGKGKISATNVEVVLLVGREGVESFHHEPAVRSPATLKILESVDTISQFLDGFSNHYIHVRALPGFYLDWETVQLNMCFLKILRPQEDRLQLQGISQGTPNSFNSKKPLPRVMEFHVLR